MPFWAVLAIAYGVAALGALVPSPWRPGFFAALVWLVILLPVACVAILWASWDGMRPAGWLALVPLTFVWLAYWDLKYGVSGRLTPPPARDRRAESSDRED